MDSIHGGTSGHLQQHVIKHEVVPVNVPALRPPHTLELSLLLLIRTTSVRLAVDPAMQTKYTQLTHSGMGVAVAPVAPAVPSTTLHGSVRPSLSQPLMILSCDHVLMDQLAIMKILFLSYLSCIFSSQKIE